MTRTQFSIRTLLWLTLIVAAFFGGMECDRRYRAPVITWTGMAGDEEVGEFLRIDTLILPDGTEWFRPVRGGESRRSIEWTERGIKITIEAQEMAGSKMPAPDL